MDIQDEDSSSAFDNIHELEPTYTLDSESDDSDSDTEMPGIELLLTHTLWGIIFEFMVS